MTSGRQDVPSGTGQVLYIGDGKSPGADALYVTMAEQRKVAARVASRLRTLRWTAIGLAVTLLGVESVIVAESWGGLVRFARLILITGRAAYGVPVTLDGVALVCALLALLAELAGESSAVYRLVLLLATTASAAANIWGAVHSAGTQAAYYFGSMSVMVAVMFSLTLRYLRASERRAQGRVTERLPRFSAMHWLRFPIITFRALSASIADGYSSPREAIDAVQAAKQTSEIPAISLDTATLAKLSARDRLAVAFGALGKADVPAALALLKEHGTPVDQSYAYALRKTMLDETSGRRDGKASSDE
jgi:hypothetical protein